LHPGDAGGPDQALMGKVVNHAGRIQIVAHELPRLVSPDGPNIPCRGGLGKPEGSRAAIFSGVSNVLPAVAWQDLADSVLCPNGHGFDPA
jgi:hypothetical protein